MQRPRRADRSMFTTMGSRVVVRFGLFWVEHPADAAQQPRLAATDRSHPRQGIHGAGAFFGGQGVHCRVQEVGSGSSVRHSQPIAAARRASGTCARSCHSPRNHAVSSWCGWARVISAVAKTRAAKAMGSCSLGELGSKGAADPTAGVGRGGESVGGVDAHGGVAVVDQGKEQAGSGSDRGSCGRNRPARRVAGHLDAVVVVALASGNRAVDEEFVAGGNDQSDGRGPGRRDCRGRPRAVRMAGVSGDPDQERDSESCRGPAVVGTHTDQHTQRMTCGRVARAQQPNSIPGLLAMREVPQEVRRGRVGRRSRADSRRHRPDVERASNERGQIRPVHKSPTHRERRIGPPVSPQPTPHIEIHRGPTMRNLRTTQKPTS